MKRLFQPGLLTRGGVHQKRNGTFLLPIQLSHIGTALYLNRPKRAPTLSVVPSFRKVHDPIQRRKKRKGKGAAQEKYETGRTTATRKKGTLDCSG
jgi:hypothetical protein